MNASTQAVHNRVDAVLALAAARLEPARHQQVVAIASEYFQRLDAQDLAERTPEDLLGALLSHLQLGEMRQPGRAKVRIFSPTAGEDGWWSRHSAIQIVNDDMPFLVDSTTLEINRQGLTLHLLVHPIYAVERDASGRLLSLAPRAKSPRVPRESWMYLEVDRMVDAQQRDALAAGIERVLGDVRAAVEDWPSMLARLQDAIADLQHAPDSVPQAQVTESRAFLEWLADDHMTLLGRCWATASTTWCRTRASRRCGWCPEAAWACCVKPCRRNCRPASRPCRRWRGPWRPSRCRCWW